MNLHLDDQVAFVAGSSRGIGLAIAEALLDEGARVVLTGRDEDALQRAARRLNGDSSERSVLAVAGDLTTTPAIEHALERTLITFGRLDHVVANIGNGSGSPGWDVPHDEWQRLFELNLFAATRLTQAALPHLLASAGGTILYIASITGVEATTAPLPYSAAKAALVNYAKNLGRQLGPRRVRVNTIAPGNILFEGGSWEGRLADGREAVEAMLSREVPLRRFGDPNEIASLAVWLCSSRAAFATGGCYVVDGGQTRSS